MKVCRLLEVKVLAPYPCAQERPVSDARVRVMHVLPHAAAGGATLQAMELARRIDPDRCSVTIALGPEAGGEGDARQQMRERDLDLVVLPHMRREPNLRSDARALIELAALVHRKRPHILHTHGSKSKLLGPAAAALGQVPVRIAHIWGWEWMPTTNCAQRWACEWEARMTAHSYDALIACSAAMREQGLARGVGEAHQYEVVLPSVDLARFNPDDRAGARAEVRAELGLPIDAPVVTSVMRLARQKAPGDLLEAAALLSARLPQLRWVIVGGGPLEKQVHAMVDDLELGDRVTLTGPRRDVARFLNAADVFALASHWEPFGIVYLEASAVGLPVIGTRVDGAPEAVADGTTGLLVDPGNTRELARTIERVATDEGLSQRLGEAGLAHAREFGHERFVAQIEDIYGRLLAKKLPQGRSPSNTTSSHTAP